MRFPVRRFIFSSWRPDRLWIDGCDVWESAEPLPFSSVIMWLRPGQRPFGAWRQAACGVRPVGQFVTIPRFGLVISDCPSAWILAARWRMWRLSDRSRSDRSRLA